MTKEQEFAFAFLAGCEMEMHTREDGQLVMRTKYPVAIQELRPGEFRACEFRDSRLGRRGSGE